MSRILVDLPHTSDANKYPKYFPHPLLLLGMQEEGDEIRDVNLDCRGMRREEIIEVLDNLLGYLRQDKRELVVNCGHYAPDADKYTYFEYFLSRLDRLVSITGVYPAVMKARVAQVMKGKQYQIIPTDWDPDVDMSLDVLEKYPRVGGSLRASMRATVGCPRKCGMCPVWLIHGKRYTFHPIEQTIERIRRYYELGVRYITFVDDNLTVSSKFDKLLEAIIGSQFKGMRFLCQEGFEVTSFHREGMCKLLKCAGFVDMYMAVENVNSYVLEKIDKYYNDFSEAKRALDNIDRHKLCVGIYFLLGLEKTEEDVLRNIRLIAERGLDVRVNIVRSYEGNVIEEGRVNVKGFRTYASLAYAASWYSRILGVNIMDKLALEQLRGAGYSVQVEASSGCVVGKTDYWRMTSRFIRGIKWMFSSVWGNDDCTVRVAKGAILVDRIRSRGFGLSGG